MTHSQKKVERLPHYYPIDVFNSIHEWYSSRSTIQPPHTCDLLFVDDSNYQSAVAISDDVNKDNVLGDEDNDVAGTIFTEDTKD